jgi:hypothetical protein
MAKLKKDVAARVRVVGAVLVSRCGAGEGPASRRARIGCVRRRRSGDVMVVRIPGQALRTSDEWCGTAVGLGRCRYG